MTGPDLQNTPSPPLQSYKVTVPENEKEGHENSKNTKAVGIKAKPNFYLGEDGKTSCRSVSRLVGDMRLNSHRGPPYPSHSRKLTSVMQADVKPLPTYSIDLSQRYVPRDHSPGSIP